MMTTGVEEMVTVEGDGDSIVLIEVKRRRSWVWCSHQE